VTDPRKLRICVGASSGGHLTQLLKLEACWKEYSTFFVTTMQLAANDLSRMGTVHVVGECNRHHPFWAIGVLGRCIGVIIKERPDVVLTTGSLPLAFTCLAAKCFGAKVVWIDSITNVERLSMSGRFVRRFADLFLTQWPHLASESLGIEYVGELV